MSNKSKGKPTASEQQLPPLPRLSRPPHLPLDLLTSWQTDSSLSRSLASCRAAFGIGIEIAIGPGHEARSTDSQWQCNNIATENGKDCKHCMHCILAHFNKKIARRGKNLLAVKARTCSRLLFSLMRMRMPRDKTYKVRIRNARVDLSFILAVK